MARVEVGDCASLPPRACERPDVQGTGEGRRGGLPPRARRPVARRAFASERGSAGTRRRWCAIVSSCSSIDEPPTLGIDQRRERQVRGAFRPGRRPRSRLRAAPGSAARRTAASPSLWSSGPGVGPAGRRERGDQLLPAPPAWSGSSTKRQTVAPKPPQHDAIRQPGVEQQRGPGCEPRCGSPRGCCVSGRMPRSCQTSAIASACKLRARLASAIARASSGCLAEARAGPARRRAARDRPAGASRPSSRRRCTACSCEQDQALRAGRHRRRRWSPARSCARARARKTPGSRQRSPTSRNRDSARVK